MKGRIIGVSAIVIIFFSGIGYYLLYILPSNLKQDISSIDTYAFSITLPEGWHLWETSSASLNVLDENFFISIIEQDEIDTKKYQLLLDEWDIKTSSRIDITSDNANYKSRNINDVIKILNTPLNGDDIRSSITLSIGFSDIDLSTDEFINDEKEMKYVAINDTPSVLHRRKSNNEINDFLFIIIPVKTTNLFDGKPITAISIARWVDKNNEDAENELITIVESLDIVIK